MNGVETRKNLLYAGDRTKVVHPIAKSLYRQSCLGLSKRAGPIQTLYNAISMKSLCVYLPTKQANFCLTVKMGMLQTQGGTLYKTG